MPDKNNKNGEEPKKKKTAKSIDITRMLSDFVDENEASRKALAEQGRSVRDITRHGLMQFIDVLEKLRKAYAEQVLSRNRNELRLVQLDRKIAIFEANEMLNVVTATDENGKPKYTNETIRKATIEKNLSERKDYNGTSENPGFLQERDALKKKIYRLKAEEEIAWAESKKYESYERLYFADIEQK